MDYHYFHIINSLDSRFGGPPVVVKSLALAQKKLGNKATIITTYLNEEELKSVKSEFSYLKEKDVELILLKGISFYRISFQLINFLSKRKKNNSIFYFHGLYRWPTSIGAFFCRLNKYKYVIRVHGSLDPYLFKKSTNGLIFYLFKKLSEKIIDFKNFKESMWIHLTSKNESIKLPNYLKKNCTLEIIPNGISVPSLEKYINIKQKYQLSSNQKILIYLGRINEKKGLDILINSFPFVFEKIKNITLLIIGPDNDNYSAKLKKLLLLMNSEISKNIIFDKKVSRSNLKSYFTQADLFILPSHTENFGMTVIESIYFGAPTLISKNVDIYNDLESNKLINTIQELKPEVLANAIFKSLDDQLLKNRVKKYGRSKINSMYSWDKIAYDINNLTDKYFNL